MVHKAVLVKELIENLCLKPGMTVIDGTLGAGGHSIEVLQRILPGGKLISIDWDERAIENFEKKIAKEGIWISEKRKVTSGPASITSNANGENISPSAFVPLFSGDKIVGYWCGVNDNYANLDIVMRGLQFENADAVFVDLGFSSDQIENEERGFSFLLDGPLDMRYSCEKGKMTAADVVNGYKEQELAKIFFEHGEEKFGRRIAKAIVKERKKGRIDSTWDLVEILSVTVPEAYKRGKLHFATKTFQALRIEVNQELDNLKIFLKKSVDVLAGGGRLAIIDFHSLEDRIIKNFFREEARDCICPPKFPLCVCSHKKSLKIITKKPITSSEKEISANPRARSAKLRVAERIQ